MNVLLPEPVWPMMPTNCPAVNVKINIVDGDFFKRCPGTVGVPEVIHPDDWRHNFVSFIGEDR